MTAWIGEALCGEGVTSADDAGGIRYSIKVLAAEMGQEPLCGAPESEVVFRVGDVAMEPPVTWDNSGPREQILRRDATSDPCRAVLPAQPSATPQEARDEAALHRGKRGEAGHP